MNPMQKKVLIVEDQQLVRAGMKTMLHIAEPQCCVVEAGNHDEAIALMASESFDVAFLDIDLRDEKTGLDILRYIREHDWPVRVIMLSATDEPQVVLDCISAGAAGYIAKGVGDGTVFEHALSTVFADGIFLPASIVGNRGHRPVDRHPTGRLRGTDELGLSPRLAEVLYYLCQGLPNKSIANRMGISEGTVRKNYVSELLRFFNVARRTALIIEVSRRGIRVPAPPSAQVPQRPGRWTSATSTSTQA
jgi:two-component system, NarL family, nitrate/nitrite response regulator NarL